MKINLLLFFLINTQVLLGQKPILPDFHADPSVHYWDGKYWIYPSTDEHGSESWSQMRRWYCYSSTDLVNWKNEGEIFNLEKISWAEERAYAPDAMKWNNKYYFFFPAAYNIGVAISEHPNGPFEDAIGKPLIKKHEMEKTKTMDPCIFIDSDSIPYLYFGGGRRAAVVRLKENLIEREGEIARIVLEGFREGLWVYKKDDTYYFTYPTHTKVNDEVKQVLAYSTAPSPYGPFTYHGTFFDSDSRNTQHSIIEVNDQWYLFYHVEGPSPYERRVCVEYLEYNENGTIKEVRMSKEGIKPVK